MKYKLLLMLCLFSMGAYAQIGLSQLLQSPTENFIEVKDSVFKEIDPDEIFMAFSLTNNMVGKQQETIHEQGQKVKNILEENNVNSNFLHIADSSEIIKYDINDYPTKDKIFILQLATVKEVFKISRALKKLDIKPVLLYKSEYSNINTLLEEVKTTAFQSAKAKAQLLAKVEDVDNPFRTQYSISHYNFREYENSYKALKKLNITPPKGEPDIVFEKIRIKVVYSLRYAVKS